MLLRDKQCLVCITEQGMEWILARSEWIKTHDILIEESAEDNGFNHGWSEGLRPGVYLVDIKPYSHQSMEGEWDIGVDVMKIKPIWTWDVESRNG